IHSEPDRRPRVMDDLEVARRARDAGVDAIVLKPIDFETASRAFLVRRAVPGIDVFGGITLNYAVGGLNVEAVQWMIAMGRGVGKIVWMPNVDAAAHLRHFRSTKPPVQVVQGDTIVPAAREILKLIARNRLVLATGHLSGPECLVLIREARKEGVDRIVVTHAVQNPINMTVDEQKEAARMGAYIEHTMLGTVLGPDTPLIDPFYKVLRKVTLEEVARHIRATGPPQVVLSSDCGAAMGPAPMDALKGLVVGLKRLGVTQAEVDLMMKTNPAKLLGL
ncbi:MAG: hypothetical protein HYY85_21525, partial [Deltaproteobacteria bacterium]|nr:hypothetical protein [Deltaproteobacteria bacterium]